MKRTITRLLLIAAVLTAGLASAFAGDAPKKTCCSPTLEEIQDKVLKGVIRLQNTDVPFVCNLDEVVFVESPPGPTKVKLRASEHAKPDLIVITIRTVVISSAESHKKPIESAVSSGLRSLTSDL